MDVVAVEIHVAAARDILDPNPLRAADRVETGRRNGLVQEMPRIAIEQRPRLARDVPRRPSRAPGRVVDVALRSERTCVPLHNGGVSPRPSRASIASSTGNRSATLSMT